MIYQIHSLSIKLKYLSTPSLLSSIIWVYKLSLESLNSSSIEISSRSGLNYGPNLFLKSTYLILLPVKLNGNKSYSKNYLTLLYLDLR
jgi:hypothetical protein